MPDVFRIEVQGLAALQQQLGGLPQTLTNKLDYVLEAKAREIELKANQLKPTNTGFMQIRVERQFLNKNITVNANYAAFVEFGTGQYAAQYVATLPQEWKEYAAQFKGLSNGGTFADLMLAILEWVKSNGIVGTYSVRSQRRLGNAAQKDAENYEAAYLIAKSIIIHGVHPHPFLYPAFNQILPSLQSEIQNVVDTFSV